MKFDTIKFEVVANPKRPTEKSIGIITLNRPENLNAVDMDMRLEANALLDELRHMNQVKVVILTGAGRAFCAGGDLPSEMVAHGNADKSMDTGLKGPYKKAMEYFFNDWRHELIQQMTVKLEALPQPTIAALNGWTVGGGLEISVCCDIRIASEQTKFMEAAIPAGFVSEVGAAFALPKLIGKGRALEMILTGRTYSAKEALEMGLIEHVVPHDRVMAHAMELAGEIASNPWLAVRHAKELVHMYWAADRTPERYRRETKAVNEIYRTDDCENALLAFKEGRKKPEFEGPHYSRYFGSGKR